MNFPTIFEWLETFDFLRGLPAAFTVIITAMVILIVWDWRLTLLALMLQYLIIGFLFVDLLDPRLVNMRVLVGLFVCLMLYMTARQVNWGRLPVDVAEEELRHLNRERRLRAGPYLQSTSLPFRFFLTLMMLLVVFTLTQRSEFQLPAIPAGMDHIHLAVYSLVGMGLLGMGLTSEPLNAGVAMLTFFNGFELFYSALEQSVAILVALAAVQLMVTLVISYLTQARHAVPELVD
jgi:hypothetical protein